MANRLKFILFTIMLGFQTLGFSQELLPYIKNYSIADYPGALQNWSIDQAENGNMYIGNQDGLLLFDGNNWRLYEMPNGTSVRSVKAINERVYVGSYAEFGYFEADDANQYNYTSISTFMQDFTFRNDQFWQILQVGDMLYFRSFADIYEHKIGTSSVKPLGTQFSPSIIFNLQQELYCFGVNSGMYVYRAGEFEAITTPAELISQAVFADVNQSNTEALVCSQNFNCFMVQGSDFTEIELPFDEFSVNNQLNAVTVLSAQEYAIGSIQKGTKVFTPTEQFELSVNSNLGINDNTVLQQTLDSENNLWLALDDGLAYAQIQSPHRFFYDKSGNLGAVYVAYEYEDKLYLGSNKGLYYFEADKLMKVRGINDQVWSLFSINGQLYCGHNEGTSIINGAVTTLVSDITGGWRLTQSPTGQYIQSTYTGFSKFDPSSSTFERIDGFVAPIKYFEFLTDYEVLAADANRGLFRLRFSDDYREILQVTDLSNQINNSYNVIIQRIKGSVYVITDQEYRFDQVLSTLVPDESIRQLYPLQDELRFIQSDSEDDIWAIHQNKAFQYDIDSQSIAEYYFPNLSNRIIPENELILQTSDSTYLLTLNNGFAMLQSSDSKEMPLTAPQIQSITSENTMFSLQEKVVLPHNHSPLEIVFGSPMFTKNYSYEYRLNPDDEWDATANTRLIFETLPSGNHQFQVRSSSSAMLKSPITTVDLLIKNPLLLRWWMWPVYILMALLLYYLYSRRQKAKQKLHQLELKKELHAQHLQKVKEQELQNEKRLSDLNNEQLEQSVKRSKKELANYSLNIAKKNELLSTIKAELILANRENPNLHLTKVLKNINASLTQSETWDLFETRFNQVHSEFLEQVKQQHPQLTRKDLKLCAYIKTNLSSKEIAPLMNKSVRGVETHRYRLRKKLNLGNAESLTEYLQIM